MAEAQFRPVPLSPSRAPTRSPRHQAGEPPQGGAVCPWTQLLHPHLSRPRSAREACILPPLANVKAEGQEAADFSGPGDPQLGATTASSPHWPPPSGPWCRKVRGSVLVLTLGPRRLGFRCLSTPFSRSEALRGALRGSEGRWPSVGSASLPPEASAASRHGLPPPTGDLGLLSRDLPLRLSPTCLPQVTRPAPRHRLSGSPSMPHTHTSSRSPSSPHALRGRCARGRRHQLFPPPQPDLSRLLRR